MVLMKSFVRDFFWDWAAVGGDAGVVDYDVGDAPFLLDGFAEVGYLGGVGDVAGEGCGCAAFARDFFCYGCELIRAAGC